MKTRWLSRLRSIQVARALQHLVRVRQRAERAVAEELKAGGALERALCQRCSTRARREEADRVGQAQWRLALEEGGEEILRAARRAANLAAREVDLARRRCAEALGDTARSSALRRAADRIERRWRRDSERRRAARDEERWREERQVATDRKEDAMHIHASRRANSVAEAAPAARATTERFEQLLPAGAASAGAALPCGWAVLPNPAEANAPVQTAGASAMVAAVELERAILERLEGTPAAQAQLFQGGVELRLRGGELDGLVCHVRVFEGAVDCRLRECSAARRVDLRALSSGLERRLAAAGLRLGRWEVQE
ncbi:MAG: hypothetical protein GYA21_09655 [Myxococcales bacterium]|nr:hypothetical protein [Myxococcales bacterium]